MSVALFEKLRLFKDARLYPGVDPSVFAKLESDRGVVLPKEHRAVLQLSNGAEVYGGYVRLFGVNTRESIDMVTWNHPDCWKFAWRGRCSEYWCFGETAWGDQYAYSLESLNASGEPMVYFMSAFSMTPRIVASSFTDFLESEFIKVAITPYDTMLKQARQKLGPLEASSHVIYIPSTLLTGTEDINNVQKMNARSAMVCNGDIATQLDAGPSTGVVQAVQTYEDEFCCTRIRLVWGN